MIKYIDEEEYDKLPPQSQRDFIWCPVCEHYYLRIPGVCSHEVLNQRGN